MYDRQGSDKNLFESLLERIDEITNSLQGEEALRSVCRLLREAVPHYDWVGFYIVSPGDELVLGPFVGAPTEHTKIHFGEGICGQAAERREAFVVQDVSEEKNYLSCSVDVKSEIVMPVFRGGRLVGELDIDSHSLSPFSSDDVEFLEEVCRKVSVFFGGERE
ncbi:MAG TPA: GAF domain-containing protein [Thermoplasmatales archaeon]|nr:GAF domain-containing protein [Thermoplasmatales archaeon]